MGVSLRSVKSRAGVCRPGDGTEVRRAADWMTHKTCFCTAEICAASVSRGSSNGLRVQGSGLKELQFPSATRIQARATAAWACRGSMARLSSLATDHG